VESTGRDSQPVDRAGAARKAQASHAWRASMVRELHILTLGLVFLFIGAIVAGVF
jgi:hypothetical protein